MRNRDIKHHLEILPAAMLPHKGEWQNVVRALPKGACLLITDPKNKGQHYLMRNVARAFRESGRNVIIWTTGENRVE